MCIICYNVYVRLINTSVHRTFLRTVVIGRLQWRIQDFPWKGGGGGRGCVHTTLPHFLKTARNRQKFGLKGGRWASPSSANGLCMYCELSWPTFTSQAPQVWNTTSLQLKDLPVNPAYVRKCMHSEWWKWWAEFGNVIVTGLTIEIKCILYLHVRFVRSVANSTLHIRDFMRLVYCYNYRRWYVFVKDHESNLYCLDEMNKTGKLNVPLDGILIDDSADFIVSSTWKQKTNTCTLFKKQGGNSCLHCKLQCSKGFFFCAPHDNKDLRTESIILFSNSVASFTFENVLCWTANVTPSWIPDHWASALTKDPVTCCMYEKFSFCKSKVCINTKKRG